MKKKIENIKNVGEFKKELLKIAENLFDSCDFDIGSIIHAPLDRDSALCFAKNLINLIYDPIRKKYSQEKDKLYNRTINDYERYCQNKDKRIKELEQKVAELTKRNNKLAEADYWHNKFNLDYEIGQQVYYIKHFGIETSKISSMAIYNEVVCILENGEEVNQKELYATHEQAEKQFVLLEAE